MVSFGIEGISRFDNARKNVKGWEDLDNLPGGAVFGVCDGLDTVLSKYKHQRKFYKPETDCAETDMRDVSFQGLDNYFADNVELFFIKTHGGNDKGIISLVYNTKAGEYWSDSRKWRLGDKKLKWLMMDSCSTLGFGYERELLPIFQKLHEICGAFDTMNASLTTDENGENIADNLTKHDKTVADAWIDGVDDWASDNHPMVVAAEKRDSINVMSAESDWLNTTMARDHLTKPVADIPNSDIYWLSVKWAEGNDIKRRVLVV